MENSPEFKFNKVNEETPNKTEDKSIEELS